MIGRVMRRLPVEDRERGSIALYFAIVAFAAFMMLGFVLDGGAALATRERAADLATQAARAGADALSPATLRGQPTGLRADPAAARQAATQLVDAAGATVDAVSVNGDQVTVKVTVPRKSVILSAVGVHDLSQSATATATAIFGGARTTGGAAG